jgi:hypothetical protein
VSCHLGGGWCWCGAAAHAAWSVAACGRGPPSSTSASTLCLSRPVLPCRQWRVVCWVGILLDVIGGVESALWEVLPRINIGADVWGESSIITGVYECWCSSTLHIGWGLCDCLCLVLVCRGRYGLGGGGSSLHSGIEFGQSRACEGSSGGRKRGVV